MLGWYIISNPLPIPEADWNLCWVKIVILIFAEVLGLYGFIVALIMNGKAGQITEELKGFVSLH